MESQLQEFHSRQFSALQKYLGDIVLTYLNDPNITELLFNTDGHLWVDHRSEGLCKKEKLNLLQVQLAIETLASLKKTKVDHDTPILECELPFNHARFEAVIPPLVQQPIFSIRKSLSRPIALIDYIHQGIMTLHQHDQMIHALTAHHNILVVGGTGSGKTTLAYALLNEIQQRYPKERLILLEDTPEIKLHNANSVSMTTANDISLTRLLKTTLRLRPDRIIVGEVRGSEALALLKAWNTGHPGGISTLHANDAQGALFRLEQLIEEGGTSINRQLIAHSIDLIIVMNKTIQGRQVCEMKYCTEYSSEQYHLENYDFFPPQLINYDLFSGAEYDSSFTKNPLLTPSNKCSLVTPN
ncbi:type IV secretion system protein VirB11 [Ferrovum sp. JA12]|uniref:P-type conjugative transfer ATPase TrbB n=1 Tax=Ferrovum sp. JA12 TaxID=1356299 RepID=UPI0007027F86|nr:P-type conjugative transfer ATPase TrbB [Ferrovum sp. JA12]KRH78266.1 type IV secretion system protein VirB11 [Ferrovum sp. JA12]